MRVAVERVAEALPARGLKLVVAESCTGGLLAAALTERPGASRFLHAGLVTYSNAAKMALLGVEPRTLAAEGAVSEGVAREMVEKVLVMVRPWIRDLNLCNLILMGSLLHGYLIRITCVIFMKLDILIPII